MNALCYVSSEGEFRMNAETDSKPLAHRMSVVGGGTMGTGIAYVFALSGWKTTVVEPNGERVLTMWQELRRAASGAVGRGKLSSSDADALLNRIVVVSEVAELSDGLDLIVESVPERLALKLGVLGACSAKTPLLLGSNTSSISIDELAAAVDDPQHFFGMHFFNPVWSLALVELIRGAQTANSALDQAQAIVAGIGKQSIVVANVPGFATSRLDLIASLEAMRMVESGVASAADIDRAAELAYRHPVGPLRLSDIVGLDVRLDIARQLCSTYGERYEPPQILLDLVAAGHLGRKTGRGFHLWPEDSPE
jgi:3-hydroxybutyryl-CoA dehydrogenase